jgi:hypothetical protein
MTWRRFNSARLTFKMWGEWPDEAVIRQEDGEVVIDADLLPG